MENPKWTDIWQAWASVGTSIFTALSVILVFVYTVITNKALKIAQRTHEESLRPVVVLLSVHLVGGSRIATYKNSGGGLAIHLKLHTTQEAVMAPDNVLASGTTMNYVVPLQPDRGILDLTYTTLTGKAVRTISYFLADGRAFNDYYPDAACLKDKKIQDHYRALEKYALSAQAIKLAADL